MTDPGFGFAIASLFAAGEQGAWYDPSDLTTLYQDAAGTTPVTATGQPVGKMLDKSGRGNHASQATAASRPVLQMDAGGRYYLAFDGVDDSLATGSINFTGTNKMTVVAGLTKQSDAASGCVVELSSAYDANAGAFALFAPQTAAANIQYDASGTPAASNAVSIRSGVPSPFSAVAVGQSDIAAPAAKVRVNGVDSATSSASQGTGTYGNYPLYIGRRAGTALPFNGNLYGLVVRGAASTAAQISATERFIANKTGVTLP